jgi:hypothetical protein
MQVVRVRTVYFPSLDRRNNEPYTSDYERHQKWDLRLQNLISRSEWPRGLTHELSSPAPTLGSWVRIRLEAWMSVCVYSVFVSSCVGIGLATGLIPRPRSHADCVGLRNWKRGKGPKGWRAIERERERITLQIKWKHFRRIKNPVTRQMHTQLPV